MSLPSPLLPSAENLLATTGKSGAWQAAFPCLAQHRAAGTLEGLAISNTFTLMQDEDIRAKKGCCGMDPSRTVFLQCL